MGQSGGATLDRWREQLGAWAVPEEILARAPESPWGFPVGLFRARAEQARGSGPTPSNREAVRRLAPGGTVAQLTERHPLAPLAPLWRRFHGLDRPQGPTAGDAVAALRSLGLEVERQDWTTSHGGSFEQFQDLVAYTRRRLCLPAGRDPELAEALEPLCVRDDAGYRIGPLHRPVVTLSWPGTAD